MDFTVCEQHQRKETGYKRILSSTSICMNRYCPNSYTFLCSLCKSDHRDHAIKILSLEDISKLTKRLTKNPPKLPAKYLSQCIDVMKKIKLFKDFRKRIDILQSDLNNDIFQLIDFTEILINQYSQCKQTIEQLSNELNSTQLTESLMKIKQNSKYVFSHIDYDFHKEKLQYSNLVIKEKQDKRRKLMDKTRRKIQEVKDYSMKIIEVILSKEDSQDQQIFEDSININKNIYKTLKQQLHLNHKIQTPENQLTQEKIQQERKSSTTVQKQENMKNMIDIHTQTSNDWIIQLRQEASVTKNYLEQYVQHSKKVQKQLKEQIELLTQHINALTHKNKNLVSETEQAHSRFEQMRKQRNKFQLQTFSFEKDVQNLKEIRQKLQRQNVKTSKQLQEQKRALRIFEMRISKNCELKKNIQREKEEILRTIIKIHTSP